MKNSCKLIHMPDQIAEEIEKKLNGLYEYIKANTDNPHQGLTILNAATSLILMDLSMIDEEIAINMAKSLCETNINSIKSLKKDKEDGQH